MSLNYDDAIIYLRWVCVKFKPRHFLIVFSTQFVIKSFPHI